jgi:hypothetical protein
MKSQYRSLPPNQMIIKNYRDIATLCNIYPSTTFIKNSFVQFLHYSEAQTLLKNYFLDFILSSYIFI